MILDIAFETKSPFVPPLTVQFYTNTLDPKIVQELRQIVIDEESAILSKTTPQNTDEQWADWLTNRLWEYNLLDLDYPAIAYFKDWIGQQYLTYLKAINIKPEKVWVQCWANLIRNDGRKINIHNHADAHVNAPQQYSYVSGNICIHADNTKTYYASPFLNKQIFPLENVIGELVMFPSYILHWTDPNLSDDPRISIAFDLITEPVFTMINNRNYRPLFNYEKNQ
jgi:hypothetical protein